MGLTTGVVGSPAGSEEDPRAAVVGTAAGLPAALMVVQVLVVTVEKAGTRDQLVADKVALLARCLMGISEKRIGKGIQPSRVLLLKVTITTEMLTFGGEIKAVEMNEIELEEVMVGDPVRAGTVVRKKMAKAEVMATEVGSKFLPLRVW